MEFELKSIKGVSAPILSEDNSQMEMAANCLVGVVGMPVGEKYSQFFAEFTLTYVWDLSISTADALLGLQAFGESYVVENYPAV